MAIPKDKHKFGVSFAKGLRKEGKSNDQFEGMLSRLTFEEIIALKLELASGMTKGKIYGVPFLKMYKGMIMSAVLKVAYAVCQNKAEIICFLGIPDERLLRDINIGSFDEKLVFPEEEDDQAPPIFQSAAKIQTDTFIAEQLKLLEAYRLTKDIQNGIKSEKM